MYKEEYFANIRKTQNIFSIWSQSVTLQQGSLGKSAAGTKHEFQVRHDIQNEGFAFCDYFIYFSLFISQY